MFSKQSKNLYPFWKRLAFSMLLCGPAMIRPFSAFALNEPVVQSPTLEIDGYVSDDDELDEDDMNQEKLFKDLKKEKKTLERKKKRYVKMQAEVEKLKEIFPEYFQNKNDFDGDLKQYNDMVGCLKSPNNKFCDKLINKKDEKKLKEAFLNEGSQEEDLLLAQTPVIAAQPQSTIPAEKIEEVAPTKIFRITPYIGSNFVSTPTDHFESKMQGGLQLESLISERVALGLGFSYSFMDITQISMRNNTGYNWYYQWYNNQFGKNHNGESREIRSKKMGIEAHSKFYLTTQTRVRPYLGAGLGYNRGEINYKNNEVPNYYRSTPYWMGNHHGNGEYGHEDYSLSYISGLAKAGMEIAFNETVGMQIEGQYSKAIVKLNSTSEEAHGHYYGQEQGFLEQLGKEIHHSSQFSLTAGLMVLF